MKKKDLDKLPKKVLLPGFEAGRYESPREYDRSEFKMQQFEDPFRRDNRISIRISGLDMAALHRLALAEGIPLQSLIANIVHDYAIRDLAQKRPEILPPEKKRSGSNNGIAD